MAATKSQGSAFTLFMVGITTAAAGIAYFSTGTGKLALLVGLVVLAWSLFMAFKIKPLEGRIAAGAQPAVMKLVGIIVVLIGWMIVVGGLFVTSSVGGRFTTTIIGFAVSLVGVLYILPAAVNKNAIWKA